MLLYRLPQFQTRKLVAVYYLDLTLGAVLTMRTTMGDLVVRTVAGIRFLPTYGQFQYVEVIKAPHPYDRPVIMLVGRLPVGEMAMVDLDVLDNRTDELSPGATVLLVDRSRLVFYYILDAQLA